LQHVKYDKVWILLKIFLILPLLDKIRFRPDPKLCSCQKLRNAVSTTQTCLTETLLQGRVFDLLVNILRSSSLGWRPWRMQSVYLLHR